MDARMADKTPRKFAQAGSADGWRRENATEIISVASACRRQIAVMVSAVRYVGPVGVEETDATGSVGDVARGKYITKSSRLFLLLEKPRR